MDPSLIYPPLLAPGEERAAQMNLKKLLEQLPAAGTNRMLVSYTLVLESIDYRYLALQPVGMALFQHTREGPTVRAIVTLRDMMLALPAPWLDQK